MRNVPLALFVSCVTTVAPSESMARDKFFGCIWQQWATAAAAPASFTNIFDQVTPENSGKWSSVEPARSSFNWTILDAMYQWSDANNALVKQHNFVWNSSQPGWISGCTDADTVKAIVRTWMTTYLKRYGSKIDMIDVVNEAVHHPAPYSDYLGGPGTTGYDWVIWVYQTARDSAKKYAPSAKLLVNEYGVINDDGMTANYLKLIHLLKDRNIIDGIGEQAHGFEGADTAQLRRNLDRLAATGLPVYISELDVQGNDTDQLASYKRLLPLFWNHPGIKGVTLWGFQEGTMWRNEAFLEHADGTDRPAFTWVKSYVGPKSTSGIRGKKPAPNREQASLFAHKALYEITGRRTSPAVPPVGSRILKDEVLLE